MKYTQVFVRAFVFCMVLVLAQAGSRLSLAEDGDFSLYLPALSYAKPEIPISPTMLVSITPEGKAGGATRGTISANGRYVVFESGTSDLVTDDTNGQPDVFVYDLHTRTMERVSIRSDGTQSEGIEFTVTHRADISADGRYVVFASSTALVADDTNARTDLYVRDRVEKTTTRLSILSAGIDGQQSNGASISPSISDDGQWISFISQATNLAPNTPLGVWGVYLHNRLTGETRQIATDRPFMFEGDVPIISPDGRYVVFVSTNPNLVSDDTNDEADIFVYDVATAQIERVSFRVDGSQHQIRAKYPAISGDGRLVVYQGADLTLGVGNTIFLFDRTTRETVWISQPLPGQTPDLRISATFPTISDDGNVVLFTYSHALVENDFNNRIDVYAYDRSVANYQRISLDASGNELTTFSSWPRISADGSRIIFSTYGDLLGNDDNETTDIYMRTR